MPISWRASLLLLGTFGLIPMLLPNLIALYPRLVYETYRLEQLLAGEHPWAPFASADEWEFAEFLATSGLSESKVDKHSGSSQFCDASNVLEGRYGSFHDKRSFWKVIDSLPRPRAGWKLVEITVTGNVLDPKGHPKVEKLELWMRNPVEVVAELMGNPQFCEEIKFAPNI